MYQLHIANKNYSSWSLRPWLLLKALEIPFTEILHPFGEEADWSEYATLNPSGLVPCLIDGQYTVWDSLAIVEYIAETNPNVWPVNFAARAWARSASAEMHSGFSHMREICSMNCRVRVALNTITEGLAADIKRIDFLWQQGLQDFGGPYLGGDKFTAVDAFYAPIVFRFLTYGIEVSEPSKAYMSRLLDHPAMLDWYDAALKESFMDPSHEANLVAYGTVTADHRHKPA